LRGHSVKRGGRDDLTGEGGSRIAKRMKYEGKVVISSLQSGPPTTTTTRWVGGRRSKKEEGAGLACINHK